MKRALLTTAGTVAGLVSVLAYSPPRATQSLVAGDAGAGLSGPAPATAGDPSTAAPENAAAGAAAGGRPIASSSAAARPPARVARTSAASRSAASRPAASRSAAPHPSAARTTTSTSAAPRPPTSRHHSSSARPAPRSSSTSSRPTASKSPEPAGPQDFTGSAITYRYGTLQVAIRVQGGKITDAWAVTYPKGSSLPYSEMAIPILRSQTLSAQSTKIAGATGATLTSTSWRSSLASALAEAGL